MTVHPLPEPTPDNWALDLVHALSSAVFMVFGDITVGQLLDAVRDVPVSDLVKALIEGEAA